MASHRRSTMMRFELGVSTPLAAEERLCHDPTLIPFSGRTRLGRLYGHICGPTCSGFAYSDRAFTSGRIRGRRESRWLFGDGARLGRGDGPRQGDTRYGQSFPPCCAYKRENCRSRRRLAECSRAAAGYGNTVLTQSGEEGRGHPMLARARGRSLAACVYRGHSGEARWW